LFFVYGGNGSDASRKALLEAPTFSMLRADDVFTQSVELSFEK